MTEETKQDGPTIEVYPALTTLSSKTDIIEHLRDVHGEMYVRNQRLSSKNPKITKDELLEVHEVEHEALDVAEWRWDPYAKYDNEANNHVGDWVPFTTDGKRLSTGEMIPHRHEGVGFDGDLTAAALAARTGGEISDKALPPGQIRLLSEIVRQDFRIIEQEMREFAAEALDVKLKEIRDEYAEREGNAPALKKKAEEAIEKLDNQLRALAAEAEAEGIVLKTPHVSQVSHVVGYDVKGRENSLRQAKEENTRALTRALARLEREKAVALRRVQLAGISPEAVKLLDDMPDARQMMVEAASNDTKELENK